MADLPSRAETLRSLAGAWRLLTFRQEGFGFFAKDAGAVWRSFFAMILAAPAFALQLESFRGELGLEDPGLHFYAVWALTYVCFWFAVPLLLFLLGERQPYLPRLPAYIQASNWVSVPASYLKLASTLLTANLGQGGDVVDLLVIGWLLGNAWWIFRRVLAIGGAQAAALVVLSELVTYALFVFAVSRTALPALAAG